MSGHNPNTFSPDPGYGSGSSSRQNVFSDSDAQSLQHQGLLSRNPDGSFNMARSLQRRRLNRSSGEDSADSSTSTSSYVPARDRNSWIVVPSTFVSEQTLTYLGFTSAAAQDILARFRGMDDESMRFTGQHIAADELLKAAHAFVSGSQDCSGTNADWNHCLLMMGIDVSLRADILHQDGNPIRFTRTCAEWVKEITETRFLELKELMQQSHEEPSQPSMGAARQVIENVKRNGATVTQIAMEAARRNPPVGKTLYKGIAQTRLAGFTNELNQVVDWQPIISSTPNDFSLQKCFYFSEELDVAEYYARYARRTSHGPAVILAITLPPHFFNRNAIPRLHFPDPNWSQLVFHCRRSERVGQTSDWRNLPVLIGDIARSHQTAFNSMNNFAQITPQNILMCTNGAKGTQWKFNVEEGADLLEQFCSNTFRVVKHYT